MMQNIGLREANQKFSYYIDAVEQGSQFIITRRGKPIARLIPIKNNISLNAAQKAAWKRSLARMKKGAFLNIKKFRREELYE
ncbi:MAG: type II toxin-antitoxin system Phd/YefM family antitoxin [Gammaproteobacteria bacterium]|nr:type II toxin-antitoxin system Phd/YefM family antitoxin [Gammaproteobacteria bacterium]